MMSDNKTPLKPGRAATDMSTYHGCNKYTLLRSLLTHHMTPLTHRGATTDLGTCHMLDNKLPLRCAWAAADCDVSCLTGTVERCAGEGRVFCPASTSSVLSQQRNGMVHRNKRHCADWSSNVSRQLAVEKLWSQAVIVGWTQTLLRSDNNFRSFVTQDTVEWGSVCEWGVNICRTCRSCGKKIGENIEVRIAKYRYQNAVMVRARSSIPDCN